MNAEEAGKFYNRIKDDPVFFIHKVLGVDTLEPWQKKAALEVKNADRISIKACHDVGKTWFVARIILWFFITRPGSKIITTAPTWVQVEKLLWAEINSAVARSKFPLGGRCLLTEYKMNDDWFAIGLSPKYEVNNVGEGQGKTSSFQGFHAPSLMVVFDEATGVRPQVWDLAEGNLTSGETKFLCIGNPTSRSCRFYDTFRDLTWKNISINCFVSPNLRANKIYDFRLLKGEYDRLKKMSKEEINKRMNDYVVVNPYLLSLKWVMTRALKWGLDHPLFVSKVLGDFPTEDENAMIPLSAVETAQGREVMGGNEGVRTIGIDCARYGSDLTVGTEMRGWKETRVKSLSQRATTEVVGEFMQWFLEGDGRNLETHIAIDGGAMGGGVIDGFREAIREKSLPWKVYEVQFGAGFDREDYGKGSIGDEECQYDKEHYENQKAKMFCILADDIKNRIGIISGIVEGIEDVYQSELPEIKYSLNSKSKICLESKDDYKKRTGKPSPDHSDSLALANYARYIKGTAFSIRPKPENKRTEKTFDAMRESKGKDFTSRGLKKFKVKDF